MGAITDEERKVVVDNSPLNGKYLEMIDSESAYEVITGRVPQQTMAPADTVTAPDGQIYGNTSGIPAAEPAPAAAQDEISFDVSTDEAPAAQPKRQGKVEPSPQPLVPVAWS